MHGLINRSIECFVRDTYGPQTWANVMMRANLGFSSFEAMLSYEDSDTFTVLDQTAQELRRTGNDVLEDLGTYLVSHPNVEFLRRLLRFGGDSFVDFLLSLDDLRDRARLAVPDLDLPCLELCEKGPQSFHVLVRAGHPGFGAVLLGVLRALADDYGALVYLELVSDPSTATSAVIVDTKSTAEVVSIDLLDTGFAQGRDFVLAGAVK